VLAVAHAVDVAVLTVDDPDFWKDAVELTFGPLPRLQQEVRLRSLSCNRRPQPPPRFHPAGVRGRLSRGRRDAVPHRRGRVASRL